MLLADCLALGILLLCLLNRLEKSALSVVGRKQLYPSRVVIIFIDWVPDKRKLGWVSDFVGSASIGE